MQKSTSSRPKGVSSRDVAQLAGVSQSTVSRAFNASYPMDNALRTRVFEAAKELKYRPNIIARSLLSKKSDIIGIAVPDIKDPFISSALHYLIHGLQSAGFQSLIFVPEQNDDVDTVIGKVLQYQMNVCIIFSSHSTTTLASKCVENGIAPILFNRYIPGSSTSSICCNDLLCGRKVAQELYECGYRSFCFISGDSDASTINDRRTGFQLQLREYGIDNFVVIDAGLTYDDGLRAAEVLVNHPANIDACFCSADSLALGVLDYLKYVAHKNVPQDIGVIGFDDILAAQSYAYNLSTVRQPWSKLIRATVSTVKELIRDPEAEPVTKLIEGTLLIRGTTRERA